MGWIISNFRMLLLAGVLLSVMGSGLYLKGRLDERKVQERKNMSAAIKGIENKREIRYNVLRKPSGEAQKELFKKWCLDCQ